MAAVVLVGLLIGGLATSGEAASKGVLVAGSMRLYGGNSDAPRSGYPTSGRVVFKREHGNVTTIGVGKSGTFSLKLEPGTYTAFGGPPGWYPRCLANYGKPFTISANHPLTVAVACDAL